ncbi:MAG: amino acid ABC transporter substrate-binding protein [Chloroflexi bacterium]|nr:amino acid ABC transporter substrate-binding protein [Chloroflexota bacterium]
MLFLLSGCFLAPAAPDRSLERVHAAGRLVVGIDPSYPPFAVDDGRGQIVGFDVDLARALAERLGVQVVFTPIDVGSIFDALLAEKFDAAISALPLYPELTKDVGFSEPYFNAGQVLIALASSDLSGPADLTGVVAADLGASGEVEARRLAATRPGLAVRILDAPEAVVVAVAAGSADAAVIDRVTALEALAARPMLRQVGEPLTAEPYVAAVRRPDARLLAEINRHLKAIAADGTLARIERRWLAGRQATGH